MPDPLPSRPVSPQPSPLFALVRDRVADALRDAARSGLPALAEALDEAAERAIEGRDRQAMFAAATRLRRESASRAGEVGRVLARRAQRCLDAAHDEAGGALALVDDEELEQQIAAGELAREARERCGAIYPRYVARLRRLLAPAFGWEDDERNPLGARTLAAALLASVTGAAEGAYVADRLRNLAWKRFAQPIADAIDAAERLLLQSGITDEPLESAATEDRTPQPAAAAPEDRSPAADDADRRREGGDMDGIAGERAPEPSPEPAPEFPAEPPAIDAPTSRPADPGRAIDLAARAERDAATLGTSPLAGGSTGPRLGALPTLQPVLDLERDAIAFAHSIGAMPYSREARSEFFGNVRARLRDAGAPPAQVAIVDLVSAMFDYVIDDRRVPEAARPLVWRLQQPTLALSLLDSGYLGDDPRSLRRLVEHFGAISAAFADEITRGSELHRRLETVVRAVEIVTSALQSRSAVMAQQVQKEYSRASRSVGQLIDHVVRERRSLEETPGRRNRRDYARRPSREREEEVTGHLHAMLAERLQRHAAPESVRDFLMNVWLRHLRTAALRDGEHSAEFQVSMRVVDDLLWSLDESGERQSRRELAQRIPPLIRLMTQGVREIGAKDEESKAFFDELFLIHLRRMQRRDRERGATRTRTPDEDATTGSAHEAREDGSPVAKPKEDAVATASHTGAETRERADSFQAQARADSVRTRAGIDNAEQHAGIETIPAPTAIAAEAGAADAEGPGRKLLEILESLDLDDLPRSPRRLPLSPEQAIDRIARGDWVELVARDGVSGHSKVAWINRRRTVALLVRRADRRAMSLRTDELRERFARGRAFLLEE
ncbi:MAG: DUF1631 domain-containing protein [Burkholderiaceae bacterium]|nr:DUF1631 domain-containing protein [Burkholderiaceae bacterium]